MNKGIIKALGERRNMRYLINGEMIREENPKMILSDLLSSVPLLKYWSYDAQKELLKGLVKILQSYSREKIKDLKEIDRNNLTEKEIRTIGAKKAKLSRFINWGNSVVKRFPKSETRALSYIYEKILGGEGKGLLRGFGFSN
jgi:hypothetical protein